jgi:hypothetical protein
MQEITLVRRTEASFTKTLYPAEVLAYFFLGTVVVSTHPAPWHAGFIRIPSLFILIIIDIQSERLRYHPAQLTLPDLVFKPIQCMYKSHLVCVVTIKILIL